MLFYQVSQFTLSFFFITFVFLPVLIFRACVHFGACHQKITETRRKFTAVTSAALYVKMFLKGSRFRSCKVRSVKFTDLSTMYFM